MQNQTNGLNKTFLNIQDIRKTFQDANHQGNASEKQEKSAQIYQHENYTENQKLTDTFIIFEDEKETNYFH